MSERCHICNARMADHYCYRCGKNVCSSCIDENGLLCRNCRLEKKDEVEGMRMGYASLKKMVNIPLFAAGIAVIIIGMILIMSASSFVSSQELQQQQQPRGFIYIFPFPFVFAWGSPDAIILLPLIVAMLALPIIMILLMFRKFTRL